MRPRLVLPIEIGNPFGDQSFTLFSGFELDRMGALVALSLAFLGYVIVNGAFKLYINTYKGRLGERMLRRLRYQLVDRVLRFPVLAIPSRAQFRNRHDDQGRGRSARRLHRRGLRDARHFWWARRWPRCFSSCCRAGRSAW